MDRLIDSFHSIEADLEANGWQWTPALRQRFMAELAAWATYKEGVEGAIAFLRDSLKNDAA